MGERASATTRLHGFEGLPGVCARLFQTVTSPKSLWSLQNGLALQVGLRLLTARVRNTVNTFYSPQVSPEGSAPASGEGASEDEVTEM